MKKLKNTFVTYQLCVLGTIVRKIQLFNTNFFFFVGAGEGGWWDIIKLSKDLHFITLVSRFNLFVSAVLLFSVCRLVVSGGGDGGVSY